MIRALRIALAKWIMPRPSLARLHETHLDAAMGYVWVKQVGPTIGDEPQEAVQ